MKQDAKNQFNLVRCRATQQKEASVLKNIKKFM